MALYYQILLNNVNTIGEEREKLQPWQGYPGRVAVPPVILVRQLRNGGSVTSPLDLWLIRRSDGMWSGLSLGCSREATMTEEKSRPETTVPTRRVSSRQMERLVGKFDRFLERSGDVMVDRFGEEKAAVMRGEMLDEYRRLIPEVPYIGGRRNIYSHALALAPRALAMYRVVVRHGGSLEDSGELLHRMFRGQMERIPKVIRHWVGRQRFGRLRKRKVEKAARRSQARRYPGDFVFERIEGDGKTFDFGIDITECGALKFLQKQGADFRLSKHGTTTAPWPPEFVERTCGQPQP